MKKVLLAIGNTEFSKILKNHIDRHSNSFLLCDQEVMHHRYLEEMIEVNEPNIIIVHDYYLPTDVNTTEEREYEWLNFALELRKKYEDTIRLVFLCERDKRDPFLHNLISNNVLDIINDNSIDIEGLIEQLKDIPRFSRVSKFVHNSKQALYEDISETVEAEEVEDTSSTPVPTQKEEQRKESTHKKRDRPVVQKVVEKKVVNKQVVKRDVSINLQQQVNKVVGVPVEKKIVLIGSPFKRSGCTFISHLLARELAKMNVSSTYIESPYEAPYTYDRFFGHEFTKNYKSKFYQYIKTLDIGEELDFDWTHDDIQMVALNPTDEPTYSKDSLPFEVFMKVLMSTSSTVTIVDVGNQWENEVFQDIYDIASNVYIVMEPDISNIQMLQDPNSSFQTFCNKIMKDKKTKVIGNRFEEGLMKNDLINEVFVNKLLTYLEVFPSKEVFDCQMDGGFLNDHPKYQEGIHRSLKPILNELLPQEFIKKLSKQKGLLRGIFNKSITISKD
ncbi:hypothetical protein [Halobacillus litoralis]|uniref:Uncharacterized protein n=1 Tax=Halobacillus litoralis TaxID=45668 RepID=A0A410MJG5_9BACI|nr:hypothetical protein [Halobacillus litoralis]QAS54818.1 hypothetical protein HLI_21435 [Halobacillus litoralis]